MSLLLTPYRKTGVVLSEAGETGSQIGFILGGVAAAALAYFTAGASVYAWVAMISAGAAIGSMVGGILDPVKPKETKNTPQSGIKDFYVTSAALGQMVPILYGTYRIPGNIIQAGKKQERLVETPVPTQTPGQKGKGGGTDVQMVFSKAYTIVLGIALCEGPIKAIKRIWTDLDLFYDSSSDLGHLRYSHETDDSIHFVGVNDSVIQIIVYKGTETQEPDGTLNNLVGGKSDPPGPGGEPQIVVSAYRGTAYASLGNFDLGASGRVPNFTFEVVKDHTAVERPIDLALGASGALYVLFAQDMAPQSNTLRYAGLYVAFGARGAGGGANQIDLRTGLGDAPFGNWAALGFVVGKPIIVEKTTISGHDGTYNCLAIDGNLMTVDHNFGDAGATFIQADFSQPKAPTNTKNRQGILRSYHTPVLREANARLTGLMAKHVAVASMNGAANDFSFVDAAGTVDGVDNSTDVGYVFVDGGTLGDPNGGAVPLRDSGEVAGGTKIGVNHVASNGNRYMYICLEEAQALEVFDVTTNGFARAGLASKPVESVWAPTGGSEGSVYVLRMDDRVTRLAGGFDLTFLDDIVMGAGAPFGHILRATFTNRIWVTNNYTDTVSHFTTAGDVLTVNVMRNPCALTEARDGFIWVASSDRGELCRIDRVTYDVQTFEVPDIMTALAPAKGGQIWAISSETRSAIYLIDPDGSFETLNLPYGAVNIVSDTSGDPYRDGHAYVLCERANTVVSVVPDCSRFSTIDSGAGLARCVEDLAVRAGLSPDRIDTSGLINTPVSFILSEVASAKDTLDLLAESFQFSYVESEGYIRFFHNYAIPTIAEIQENVLAGGIDKEDIKSLGVSRLQERELPTKVSVTYTSPERNYQDRSEVVQLTSGNIEQNPQVYRYPFAMTPEDAFQMAEIRLFEPWAQRERAEFTLPPLFILLDPGDAVEVRARDISYNIRINEMTRARTWLNTVRGLTTYPPTFLDPELQIQALALRAVGRRSRGTQASVRSIGKAPIEVSLYQDTIPTPGKNVVIRDPSNPEIVLVAPGTGLINLQNPSPMAMILIDPPALSPGDVFLRAYLGTYRLNQERAFSQASLYRSPNGTIDFTYAGTDATESTAGRSLTLLPDTTNPYVWDDVSTVDIEMLHGTLRMVSEMDVLSGANRAMLGGELIQFMRPTLIAPKTYRLSRLLRGRLGTEAFTGTHAVGEGFVLLDANTLRDTYLFERAIVDHAYFYRVIDSVTSLTAAASFTMTLHGNSLKPWAPVLRDPVRNEPAPDDVAFTWLYRSRLAPDLIDYSGIAWDIDFTKQFHVRIYTDATYSTVRNTYFMEVFIGSAEALLHYVYTVANQVADFGSVQASVYYGIVGVGAQSVLGYESRGVA